MTITEIHNRLKSIVNQYTNDRYFENFSEPLIDLIEDIEEYQYGLAKEYLKYIREAKSNEAATSTLPDFLTKPDEDSIHN